MIQIKIRCKGSIELPLNEIHILQDIDGEFCLKELSQANFEKLKENIVKDGFWFPFFVWWCEEEGKWYYLDGTQRDKVLRWMAAQPNVYQLPEKFPCAEIEASSKQEAAKAILEQSSAFGRFNDEGLYAYINKYGLKDELIDLINRLEIPGYNIQEFYEGYFNDFDIDVLNGDYEKGSPDHEYSGNSIPFRFGDIIGFISDKQKCDAMIAMYKKIVDEFGENQSIFNEISNKMVSLILENEDIFCK